MAASGYKVFTTGDVLTAADVNNYLMLQTVMVFANAAARTTALSGVLAEGLVSYLKDTDVVEIYTGAAWVSLDDPNAVQNASYYAAGKNAIINGAFNVWQRGTSIALAASTAGYTADRWQVIPGAGSASTISRQSTNDTTNLPFIQYCTRVQRNAGQTGATQQAMYQSFESATSTQFVGRSVTLSFYARAGANFSPTSGTLNAAVYSGTGTDQNIGVGGYTGSVTVASGASNLTTTWTRYTVTGTVGATATELSPYFYWTTVGTAGANDYVEITGVQLEIGATATAFQTASGTIGGELALCQRYYIRNGGVSAYQELGFLSGTSATGANGQIPVPATMRVAPTSIDFSTLSLTEYSGNVAVTNLTLTGSAGGGNVIAVTATVASGLTQYRIYSIRTNNSTSGYIGFSAEL